MLAGRCFASFLPFFCLFVSLLRFSFYLLFFPIVDDYVPDNFCDKLDVATAGVCLSSSNLYWNNKFNLFTTVTIKTGKKTWTKTRWRTCWTLRPSHKNHYLIIGERRLEISLQHRRESDAMWFTRHDWLDCLCVCALLFIVVRNYCFFLFVRCGLWVQIDVPLLIWRTLHQQTIDRNDRC